MFCVIIFFILSSGLISATYILDCSSHNVVMFYHVVHEWYELLIIHQTSPFMFHFNQEFSFWTELPIFNNVLPMFLIVPGVVWSCISAHWGDWPPQHRLGEHLPAALQALTRLPSPSALSVLRLLWLWNALRRPGTHTGEKNRLCSWNTRVKFEYQKSVSALSTEYFLAYQDSFWLLFCNIKHLRRHCK